MVYLHFVYIHWDTHVTLATYFTLLSDQMSHPTPLQFCNATDYINHLCSFPYPSKRYPTQHVVLFLGCLFYKHHGPNNVSHNRQDTIVRVFSISSNYVMSILLPIGSQVLLACPRYTGWPNRETKVNISSTIEDSGKLF